MSGYTQHILAYWIISFIIFLGLHEVNSPLPGSEIILISVIAGTFYAILPDIDTPNSIARRAFEKAALAVVVVLLAGYLYTNEIMLVYAAIIIAFILFILWTMKHRGIFHTLIAGMILSLPLLLYNEWTCGFAFLGYSTHLLVDQL